MSSKTPTRIPDLSARPFDCSAEHWYSMSPAKLYEAFTSGLDRWFAAPGSMLLKPEVDAVFFFETEFKPEGAQELQRHPHYGRFLRLIPNKLVELTWLTGALGTEGAETVVTVQITPEGGGTRVHLRHAGFANAASRDRHRDAWPMVLAYLESKL
jgi:uncharacterized protein YndB with AHSA1/START domain